MDDTSPWSRWILNLVLPGRLNDTFSLRSPQVLLTESESKLLARYAVSADHLVGPPPASLAMNGSGKPQDQRGERVARTAPPAPVHKEVVADRHTGPPPLPDTTTDKTPQSATRGALGVGQPPPLKLRNVGLGIAVNGDTLPASPATPTTPTTPIRNSSRNPLTATVNVADDAPSVFTPPPKRRPKVLNKLSLGSATTGLDGGTPPATPNGTRYPQSKVRPAMATLEKAAACALFFEQFYDSLQRKTGSAIGGGRQRRGRASAETFDFGRVIGQGAFGVVRIAKEKENGRMVAIKQLRKVDLLRMGQEGHVRAEKDLLSAAASQCQSGPNWIPELYYSFQDEDHLYLALEFMGGGDLLTLLVDRGYLPESMMRFYAAEMILGLHQTHQLGYIHRDVKPDNFLFTSDGHIRIADFGLATDLHWAHDSAYYEHQRRAFLKRHGVPLDRPAFGNRRRGVESMQGGVGAGWGDKGKNLLSWRTKNRRKLAYTICGTNSYMAPEVIRGNGYGFSVDWWGLGVIIYEAIYGTIPFVGETREHARRKILDWRNHLHFPRRGVSPLAIDFMKKLLCDPEDRLGHIGPARRASASGGINVGRRVSGGSTLSVAATTDSGSVAPVPLVNGTVSVLEGPLGHDGVEQLMAHPWFADIEWAHLHETCPPFQPELKSADDTRHFDEDIPDEPLAPGNSALYLRDALLGDKQCGKETLALRKELAFKGWTFRSKANGQHSRTPGRRGSAISTNNSLGSSNSAGAVYAHTPSSHRSRKDASRTIRAPEHEPTMQSLYPFSATGTDSDFSDSDVETEVGWSTDDIEVDEHGKAEMDIEPVPETPEIEMEDDDNVAAEIVDSYLASDVSDVSYGYPRPPRRLYPRGYEVYPRFQPNLNSFERAYDDHWWETHQLDWREMIALGDPEDYARPSCVPESGSPARSAASQPSASPESTQAAPAAPLASERGGLGASVLRSKTKLLRPKEDSANRGRAMSMPPVNLVSLRG